MSIETYGAGGRTRVAARLIAGDAPLQKGRHLVLLPIPTTKDKEHINGTDILLSETLLRLDDSTAVIGYGMPNEYKEAVKRRGASILDLALDEPFLEENAYITAIGALGHIFTTEERIPEDISFGIVGYGRIGKALLRLLLFTGASVKVYTTHLTTHISLSECGVESVYTGDKYGYMYDFSGIDILINTAPKNMAGSMDESTRKDGFRIIELASGDNFSGVSGVTRLPALPERMFPESAGRAYYRAVKRFIQCEVDKN